MISSKRLQPETVADFYEGGVHFLVRLERLDLLPDGATGSIYRRAIK